MRKRKHAPGGGHHRLSGHPEGSRSGARGNGERQEEENSSPCHVLARRVPRAARSACGKIKATPPRTKRNTTKNGNEVREDLRKGHYDDDDDDQGDRHTVPSPHRHAFDNDLDPAVLRARERDLRRDNAAGGDGHLALRTKSTRRTQEKKREKSERKRVCLSFMCVRR